jgi:hypothetical protein
LTGSTRLRVITFQQFPGPGGLTLRGCGSNPTRGETEDYTIHILPFIPENDTVQNLTLGNGQDTCINAFQTIHVAGSGTNFVVQNGGSATFIAGQKIIFKPVSKVLSGGYLHAWITTGSNFCNLVMTPVMIAVKDLEVPDSESGSADNEKLTSGLFSIYPNPTSGIFTIGFRGKPAERQARVQCYNILGSELIDQFIDTASRHEFSLLCEQPGVYLLKVTMNGEVCTRKIVRK